MPPAARSAKVFVLGLAACASLAIAQSTPPSRPKLFTPNPARSPQTTPRAERVELPQVEQALAELQTLLATRHAYSVIAPVPQSHFDKALAHARTLATKAAPDADTPPSITFDELGEVLALALAGSIDGHGSVGAGRFPRSRPALPVLLQPWEDAQHEGPTRVLALRADRSPLSADHPSHTQLLAIDGIPTQDWLQAASRFVPSGTRALRDRWSLGLLSSLPIARRWLDVPPPHDLPAMLTLGDPLDPSTKPAHIEIALRNVPDEPVPFPQTSSGMLDGAIAYLRLPSMIGDVPGLREVRRTLDGFANPSQPGGPARALIIDLRGNGGGARDLIPLLADALLPAGHPPIVFTASRVLVLPNETELQRKERTENRDIYLRSDVRLSPAQRDAIDGFLASYTPQVTVPDDRFAPLYFGLLTPAGEGRGPVISGPIVALMDGGCFSAADVCLAALAEFPSVTLMGQPSAGGSGYAESMSLFQGKAWARLSTMATFRKDGSLFDGKGITPDVLVPAAPTDFVKGGTDSVLEFAKAYLRNKLDEAKERP